MQVLLQEQYLLQVTGLVASQKFNLDSTYGLELSGIIQIRRVRPDILYLKSGNKVHVVFRDFRGRGVDKVFRVHLDRTEGLSLLTLRSRTVRTAQDLVILTKVEPILDCTRIITRLILKIRLLINGLNG